MAKRIREKAAARELNKDRRPRAVVKQIRMNASKVARVLNLIRGKSYFEAVAILDNAPYSAAKETLKVLKSAGANAENNLSLNKEDLFVAETYSAQGPTLKRLSIRARGRADRLLKRTCHITVILDTVNKES
jgi:large subunit ribosomal protein L22